MTFGFLVCVFYSGVVPHFLTRTRIFILSMSVDPRKKGSGNSKAVGLRVAIIACPRSFFLAYLPVVAAVSIEKWAKRGPQRHSGGKMNHEFLLSSSLRRGRVGYFKIATPVIACAYLLLFASTLL